jgi:hypothetical protein
LLRKKDSLPPYPTANVSQSLAFKALRPVAGNGFRGCKAQAFLVPMQGLLKLLFPCHIDQEIVDSLWDLKATEKEEVELLCKRSLDPRFGQDEGWLKLPVVLLYFYLTL